MIHDYFGVFLRIVGGRGKGQSRLVVPLTSWKTAPDWTSKFEIVIDETIYAEKDPDFDANTKTIKAIEAKNIELNELIANRDNKIEELLIKIGRLRKKDLSTTVKSLRQENKKLKRQHESLLKKYNKIRIPIDAKKKKRQLFNAIWAD